MATLASAPARLAGKAVLAVQSDERLARLVRDGHERAFDALVERYRAPLIRYCGRILPASRAEDAVQQTFINAHAALARADEPADVKAWLYKIAHNAALNMLRQNGWNYEEIPLDFDGVRRPDQVVEQRIQLQNTVAAVGSLPERQRTALVMRELEGRSYAEIAAALGGGDGAVRQLLNRARATLRGAATALTPSPLIARVVTSMPGDGSGSGRISEALGAVGAGGLAKVGATALVAGTIVVGAVNAPISTDHRKHGNAAAPSGRKANAPAPNTVAAEHATRSGQSGSRHSEDGAGHRSGRQSPASGSEREHSRLGDDRRSGDDNRTGSGERSGSRDDGALEHSGSTAPATGNSGPGSLGSGGGTSGSGTSGSGTSGSGTSGSGTSGSGTDDGLSGSGTSGSGTSGSGTDDGLTGSGGTSGSGTSGSGHDDGVSGSGTSGSGTSGSGGTSTTTTTTTTTTTDTHVDSGTSGLGKSGSSDPH